MLPQDTYPYADKNRYQTRAPTSTPSVISSSSIRYATPASLPPAFGVNPLHMWESSVATSTPSHVGTLTSYAISESGTRYSPKPKIPAPRTPVSTAEWVQSTIPSSMRTTTPSNVSNSYVSAATHQIRAPNFNSSQNHLPTGGNSDDYELSKGGFDVDGSIPSSDEDEESPRPFSKYVDDMAQEAGGKRKRKAAKLQLPNNKTIKETIHSDSEEETRAAKRRKNNAKVSSAPKKKPSNKPVLSKPARTPNKPNGKQPRQVDSDDEDVSSDEESFAPSSSKARSNRTTRSENPLSKWMGLSQGVLQFFPKLQSHKTEPTPLWTYSPDGITRQSPNHRALGCIHFSPSLATDEEFHYWVQVGTKSGGCWELYNPGRQHPAYPGYILQGCDGDAPPCWFHPRK
ncbi:hypothetical protein FRC12_021511 [Ceratobasidium sp. 428]|nr:hypothetical protein FRC12_021511 [Ceratobasidium sp. 428]